MLLHIFGDTHGPDEIFKINPKKFLDRDLTKDDAIVVCGDFGLPFFPTDRIPANELKAKNYPQHNIKSARAYKMYTDWLASFPCDILFVDGNHDNHAFWAEQHTEQWNGGLIQRLPEASNVIHLMRGEYYTIDGMTVWCMGGAESIDKIYRTEGVTWWREEIPSMKETWHGFDTLEEHGNKVDIILTHTLPQILMPIYFRDISPINDPTGVYLNEIYRRVEFKQWFCGHMFQLRRKSKQFLEYDTGRRESVLIQENSAVIRRPKGQRIAVGPSGLRDNQALRYRPAQLQAGWTCGDDEELLPPVLVRQRTPQARGGRAGLSSPFRPKRNVIGSRAKQKRNGRCRIPQWKR